MQPFFKLHKFVYKARKLQEVFQKILPLTGPICENGASLIESSHHTNLITMFSCNSIKEYKSRSFRLL